MDAPWFNGDDDRDRDIPPEERHQPEWDCECHCHRCHAPLEPSPYSAKVFSSCGDCEGGREDGEAFRGGEAAAYQAEQMAHIQRTLK